MTRHLITGGAGFIGSHLADQLLERGDSVIALDDLSTGSRENVAGAISTGRFSLVEGSILNEALVVKLAGEVDQVFHLAAAVGVRLVAENAVTTLVTNAVGTANVLRAAALHSRPILIASSSEVYGRSTAIPFCEDATLLLGPTTRPRWGYACSKAYDEFLALAYAREQHLRVVVARLFNTVGPRQSGNYGMVLPTFVRQALEGKPLTVLGDGTQSRCFTWVGDVVRAIAKLLDDPRAASEVVNIGSTEEISIRQLAERVRMKCGSSSAIESIPFSETFGAEFDDIDRRVPSIDRARALIGFEPTQTLDAILDRVIAFERGRSAI